MGMLMQFTFSHRLHEGVSSISLKRILSFPLIKIREFDQNMLYYHVIKYLGLEHKGSLLALICAGLDNFALKTN